MDQARVLVTGPCGLIGSEVCLHFHQAGYSVLGIDNNQRAVFFGPEGDTSWSLQRLCQDVPGYEHHDIDILDRECILHLVGSTRPAVIVHTAAQPSHDRAAQIAFDDYPGWGITKSLRQTVAEIAVSWSARLPDAQ